MGSTGDPEHAAQAEPLVGRPEVSGEADVPIHVVPVRRDGSGRLVAVGLLRATDSDGEECWKTVGGRVHAGETLEGAVDRCLGETLGSEVRAQLSPPGRIGRAGPSLAAWG
ncbi:MAG: DUF4916 domain-containing protein [Candidatus Limnocylindrales bacterium]